MVNFPLVSIAIFLPLFSALYMLLFVNQSPKLHKRLYPNLVAMLSSILTLITTIYIWVHFDATQSNYQFMEMYSWISQLEIYYHVGVDGLSLFFIVLSAFLTSICIIVSFFTVKERVVEYLVAILAMEGFMIGVFAAIDTMLFYIFFEAILIPMFLIIGIWGGKDRVKASLKFFLYTLFGSLAFLAALIYIYNLTDSFSMLTLTSMLPKIDLASQKILWLAFFLAFAIKIPMVPFHTWLPDAHVQAPTTGSMILAGILLKLGGYGLIRFSLLMLPEASKYFADMVIIMSIVAIIYASFVAFAQKDMKKLIAYSSIAHMGYVTMGIFSFNYQALDGAIIQMISHGIVSAGLFLAVGIIYERIATKEIAACGGIALKMPIFAAYFLILTLSSVGLPGTSGFVGEFLTLLGIYKVSAIYAAFAATGILLGAIYMLFMFKKVMYGKISNKKIENIHDLTLTEKLAFLPLIITTIILGIYPSMISKYFAPVINQILQIVN